MFSQQMVVSSSPYYHLRTSPFVPAVNSTFSFQSRIHDVLEHAEDELEQAKHWEVPKSSILLQHQQQKQEE